MTSDLFARAGKAYAYLGFPVPSDFSNWLRRYPTVRPIPDGNVAALTISLLQEAEERTDTARRLALDGPRRKVVGLRRNWLGQTVRRQQRLIVAPLRAKKPLRQTVLTV